MGSFVSTRTGQVAYFDRQLGHPDWSGARVLDFGGHVGNILLDPHCAIGPDRYWSLYVSRDAMAEGPGPGAPDGPAGAETLLCAHRRRPS